MIEMTEGEIVDIGVNHPYKIFLLDSLASA